MASKSSREQLPLPTKFSFPDVRGQSEVLWQDSISGNALRISLVFFLISVGLIFWQYGNLPPEVPLFYGKPWGEAQLTNPLGLMFLPGVSLLVLLTNGFLGGLVFKTYKLLSRMLLIVAALVGFLASFSLIRILILIA